MWWYRTICLSCSSTSLRLLFLFLILLVSFLARLLTWLDLTLPLSISLCALEKISVSQMLPDAAGLYHLRKALLFTNAVPINAGWEHNAPAAAAATFKLLTVTKNMSSITNYVFCEYMYIICDDIALFVSAVALLVSDGSFCLLFCLSLS